MKKVLSSLLAFALLFTAAPAAFAEPHQVMQGTQVHLTLLSKISTAESREGDPFVAVVAEPVYLGNQLLIKSKIGCPEQGDMLLEISPAFCC